MSNRKRALEKTTRQRIRYHTFIRRFMLVLLC